MGLFYLLSVFKKIKGGSILKKLGILWICAVVLLFFTACSQANSDENVHQNKEEKRTIKIGMITDTGGIDDKSFNQSAWEGIQAFAKANGLTEGKDYKYLQSSSEAEYETNLNQFVQANFDLTFAVGYKLKPAVEKIAAANPKSNFAIIDEKVDLPNVTSATFKDEEGAFLVGIVAAMTSETNTVGFIGGEKSALMQRFESGFEAGVKSINPKAKVLVQYANSFSDAAKGSAIASAMYGQNADVIYVAAGGTGNGVFTEAKNRKAKGENVWVIGSDRDQYKEGLPENVTLTSMVKGIHTVCEQLAVLAQNGDLKAGTMEFGLKEGGVGISDTTENIGEDTLGQINDYEQKIITGEIIVPKTRQDLDVFLANLKS